MRITFVLPTLRFSGGNRVVAIYARALQDRGHVVTIVAPSSPGQSGIWPILKLRRGTDEAAKDSGYSREMYKSVPQRELSNGGSPVLSEDYPDADIVVATWWETAEWVAELPLSKGVKAYFIQHYEAFDYLPKDRVDATYRLPLRQIAVAQWLVDLMKSRFGVSNTALVPNAVDTNQFHAVERVRQAHPTVGFVYSSIPWKRADLAIDACKVAKRSVPHLRVVVFGQNVPDDMWVRLDNVTFEFRPQQSRLREIYTSCDAWLFTSSTEGFGLPILEAMACGTPVIGTPAGAAPDLLAGGAGVLVSHDDIAMMAEAIVRVTCGSKSEWMAMSEKARDLAGRYVWADATDLFEATVRSIIEESKS